MEASINMAMIGPRASGKTTELILRCYEENLKENNLTYIVCPTREDAKNIYLYAKEKLNKKIPLPITIHEFIDLKYSYIKNVLIDDIDRCIKQLNHNFRVLDMTLTVLDSDKKN